MTKYLSSRLLNCIHGGPLVMLSSLTPRIKCYSYPVDSRSSDNVRTQYFGLKRRSHNISEVWTAGHQVFNSHLPYVYYNAKISR
eukprot:scaffold2238_cov396-Prasinococcus_capsulatus_cf.AAC.5